MECVCVDSFWVSLLRQWKFNWIIRSECIWLYQNFNNVIRGGGNTFFSCLPYYVVSTFTLSHCYHNHYLQHESMQYNPYRLFAVFHSRTQFTLNSLLVFVNKRSFLVNFDNKELGNFKSYSVFSVIDLITKGFLVNLSGLQCSGIGSR